MKNTKFLMGHSKSKCILIQIPVTLAFISRKNNWKILHIILMRFQNIFLLFLFYVILRATKIQINNFGVNLHNELVQTYNSSKSSINQQISHKNEGNQEVYNYNSKSHSMKVVKQYNLMDASDKQNIQSNIQQNSNQKKDTENIIYSNQKYINQKQSTAKNAQLGSQIPHQKLSMHNQRLLLEQDEINKLIQFHLQQFMDPITASDQANQNSVVVQHLLPVEGSKIKQISNKQQQLKSLQQNIRQYLQITSQVAAENIFNSNLSKKEELVSKNNNQTHHESNNSTQPTKIQQQPKAKQDKKSEKVTQQINLNVHQQVKNAGSAQSSQIQVQVLKTTQNQTKNETKQIKRQQNVSVINSHAIKKQQQKKQTNILQQIIKQSVPSKAQAQKAQNLAPQQKVEKQLPQLPKQIKIQRPQKNAIILGAQTSSQPQVIKQQKHDLKQKVDEVKKQQPKLRPQPAKQEERKQQKVQILTKIQQKVFANQENKQPVVVLRQSVQTSQINKLIPSSTAPPERIVNNTQQLPPSTNQSTTQPQQPPNMQQTQLSESTSLAQTSPDVGSVLTLNQQLDFSQLQKILDEKQRQIEQKQRELQRQRKQLAEFKALMKQNKGQKGSVFSLTKLLKDKINQRKNTTNASSGTIIVTNSSSFIRNLSISTSPLVQKTNRTQSTNINVTIIRNQSKSTTTRPRNMTQTKVVIQQKPIQLKIQPQPLVTVQNTSKIINESTTTTTTTTTIIRNQSTTQQTSNQTIKLPTTIPTFPTVQIITKPSSKLQIIVNNTTKIISNFTTPSLLNFSTTARRQVPLSFQNDTMQQKFRNVMRKYWSITNNLNNDYLYGFNIVYALQCLVKNHRYEKVGKSGFYRCIKVYKDGLKPCFSSTQCQGDCIIRKHSDFQAVCQTDDNPFGCWNTIQYYEFNGRIICME